MEGNVYPISFADFEKVELRVGTILNAELNQKALKPSYKLWIDFGDTIGIKQSSAQITNFYTTNDLIQTQIIAVTNFPPKKIAGFTSEVLVCGFILPNGGVILVRPDKPVPNGLLLR